MSFLVKIRLRSCVEGRFSCSLLVSRIWLRLFVVDGEELNVSKHS